MWFINAVFWFTFSIIPTLMICGAFYDMFEWKGWRLRWIKDGRKIREYKEDLAGDK